jgi:hypothetical protein
VPFVVSLEIGRAGMIDRPITTNWQALEAHKIFHAKSPIDAFQFRERIVPQPEVEGKSGRTKAAREGLFIQLVMLAQLGGYRLGHDLGSDGPQPAGAHKSWRANPLPGCGEWSPGNRRRRSAA